MSTSDTSITSTSKSTTPLMANPSITGCTIITTEKLKGSNYSTWAADVELWFMGQGYKDHLTTKPDDTMTDPSKWERIDAQLCSMLWQTIDSSLKQIFRPHKTCFSVWEQAKALYTNDISRVYAVCSDLMSLIAPRKLDMPMSSYLGRIQGVLSDFNELLPPAATQQEQLSQRGTFFMLLALFGLPAEYSTIRDQILASPTIPTLSQAFSRLLRLPDESKSSSETIVVDSSALASQSSQRGGRGRGRGRGGYNGNKNRPYCDYCKKVGHTEDRCWLLHGRPPQQVANIVQSEPCASSEPTLKPEYEDFVKWFTAKQSSTPTASVVHTSNVSACVSQSPSLGPWVLDSAATDHISGNPQLFSSLHSSTSLPNITLADGSQTQAKGIGKANPLPSVPLDSVLFIPNCPFSLVSVRRLCRSLNCLVTFDEESVILQDRGTGRTIGTGRESQGLYHLSLPTPVSCSAVDDPLLIHSRLGHPSLNKFRKMVPSITMSSLECASCQLGKHTRSHFPKRANSRAESLFSLVHTDIWGPSRVISTLGFQYFVTFIDDYSRCTWVFLMKNRSEVFSIFQSFVSEIQTQFGVSIKILRSDNAHEYFSTSFKSFMESKGIIHQSSCSHTSQQNGIAERKNRHLVETARTLLLHANVPLRFWGDAILTACYLINRMPSSVLKDQVPYSFVYPNAPLFSISPRTFGCTCFVHDFTPGKDKLSSRAVKCVFLGYSRTQKGYKCFSPDLRRYIISADVTFFESTPFFQLNKSEHSTITEDIPVSTYFVPLTHDTDISQPPKESLPSPASPPLLTYQRRNVRNCPTTVPDNGVGESADVPDASRTIPSSSPTTISSPASPPIAVRKGIRSTRNQCPNYTCLNYQRVSSSYYAFLSSLSSMSVPKTIGEAMSHSGWRQAMIDEMAALHSNSTWELVPLPPGKSTVGCRWIYTVKVGPDGQIDRLKARLVAKGYTQIFGLDYTDTFSPVAKMSSVRLILSLSAVHHWPLHQLDIKNAFLHGALQEEVYMDQPPGFVIQGKSSGMVCRLKRALYGLKQSPRAWFGRFRDVVQKYGMIRSEADHSVFYRHSPSKGSIYLVVYVDDIIITGQDHDGIAQLKNHLFGHFQTKDLGKLRYFLGIEVAQSKEGVVICQRKYALDILEEAGMSNAKPVETPMDPNIKLFPGQGEPLKDPGKYRRLVGRLNYLTVTRPDISFSVSVISQFLDSPCDTHWNAAIRILKYIKGAPGQGLLYTDKGNMQVIGYTDADWAGSPIDRRSTTGYCILVGGNLISWKSKKQDVVARSSAEAEYRAMAMATCELIWLKQLLNELNLGTSDPMKLICDNQAALHIASNPVFHERTKHIEVDCHFVREKLISKVIETGFVNSSDQLADFLTKSLRGPRIKYICGKLGAYDLYAPT